MLSLPAVGHGDEYFYVDGKSHGFDPDQGTAIKSERAFISEGNIDMSAGLGIGCGSSTSARSDSQMRSGQPSIRSRNSIDSTDECFLTYAMFQRQYCP